MQAEQAAAARLYRAVAAVVGVAAGGGVRPGRDHQRPAAGGAGAGEEPAVGGGQARRLRASGWAWTPCRRCCCTRRWPSGSPGARRACPAWRAGRCARTCGSSAAGWCRSCIRRTCRCRGNARKQPYSPAEIGGFLALADAQPTTERRMRAAGLVCLGAGAGLIRGDLRDVRGSRRGMPVRRGRGHRARRPAAHGAGAGPLPRPAAGRGPVRRGRPGLRRDRSRPPEPDEPADHRAGRRERAAPAGHLPAAGDLAAATARSCWGWPRSCTRPGSAAPSGSATWSPGWSRPARPRRSGCSGRPGAMIPLAAFEEIIDASGVAPRIEAMLPIGVRPRQLTVRTLLAGMCLAQADHRPAHLTRVHQALTSLPEDDQRRLGVIADWKHGPHLLTYRQTERTFGLVADALGKDEPDGLPSGPLQRICDDLLEASVPEEFKDASTLAGRGLDGPGVLLPAPAARGRRLRRPRGVLGPPQEQPAAQRRRAVLRVLPVRRDHDARGERARRPRARPPRHGVVVPARPGPRVRARADRDARRRDPARRHPRRLRLRPPRRRRLGAPAARRRRAARPGPAPPRPRPQGHPPRRHHQQREPVLPAAHPARCWNSGRSPAPPPGSRPRTTTARPPSSPATSSAASPPTTPTATTASSAPPPWARSAARSGPPR